LPPCDNVRACACPACRDLSALDRVPELQDLVEKMTHPLPLQRPTAADLANHPFFWPAAKALSFLQNVSDAVAGLQSVDHEGACVPACLCASGKGGGIALSARCCCLE
jgi:hypothetical protein